MEEREVAQEAQDDSEPLTLHVNPHPHHAQQEQELQLVLKGILLALAQEEREVQDRVGLVDLAEELLLL